MENKRRGRYHLKIYTGGELFFLWHQLYTYMLNADVVFIVTHN